MAVVYVPEISVIREKIRLWFISASGLERVILSNQKASRPQKPYATLNVTTVPRPVGEPEKDVVEVDGVGKEILYQTQETIISFKMLKHLVP